tara:strand:- start:41819 stop:42310 length:492 start_codon:yes stop_codon:yes gene_type:complete
MRVGVVSDTHNNHKNVNKIIKIFNQEDVGVVFHTGDISNSKTLSLFQKLHANLIGVYGNNDREERGLDEVCKKFKFTFKNPPLITELAEKRIAVLHEPELLDPLLKDNKEIDIVLYGHTHRYHEERLGNVLVYNPGESAGMMEGLNSIGIINLKNLETQRIFF